MLRRATAAAAARGWQGSAYAVGAGSSVPACSATAVTERQAFWHAKSVRRLAEQASKQGGEGEAAAAGWFKVGAATEAALQSSASHGCQQFCISPTRSACKARLQSNLSHLSSEICCACPLRAPPTAVQDFAQHKVRLLAAAALGIVALNAGASAAFDWYYNKQGKRRNRNSCSFAPDCELVCSL